MERGSSKHGHDERVGSGLSPADVDARAEIAKHLRPSTFPATAETLLESARGEEAPSWIIDELARLPADVKLDNVQDLWVTLGHRGEAGRA